MYTENLPHILNLLEVSAQNGTLSLTPIPNKEDAAWQAIGLLREGKLSDLKIRRMADGLILLGGPAALDWLNTQKGLYWQFRESSPDELPLPPTTPIEDVATHKTATTHPYALKQGHVPGSAENIPRRTFLGTHLGARGVPAHMWSREHRTVFLLIDGTRDKNEILRLLPASFDQLIDMILADLKSAGLIE